MADRRRALWKMKRHGSEWFWGSLRDIRLIGSSREAQTWGAGRAIVSEGDRKEIKRARKEGRLAEAMLDRRAALKR